METLVTCASISGTVYVIAALYKELQRIPITDTPSRVKTVNLMICGCGALLWPTVFVLVLNSEFRQGIVARSRLLWLASSWVMGLFVLDAFLLSSSPAANFSSNKSTEIRSTFLSVVSTVFAFGVLLTNIIPKGQRRSSRSAIICVTGLLIGLAFAIPVFDATESLSSHIILATTKSVISWAIGVFVSGIVLELSQAT